MWLARGSNQQPLDSQSDSLLTVLGGPAGVAVKEGLQNKRTKNKGLGLWNNVPLFQSPKPLANYSNHIPVQHRSRSWPTDAIYDTLRRKTSRPSQMTEKKVLIKFIVKIMLFHNSFPNYAHIYFCIYFKCTHECINGFTKV